MEYFEKRIKTNCYKIILSSVCFYKGFVYLFVDRMKEAVPFEVEFQILDSIVVVEKQQIWKRKFVSMDLMRLIRKALDKLKEKDIFWKEYKCFERPYGLTILSNDERKHLSLYPLATAPCSPNCILFHQQTGRFQDWFSWERLLELVSVIQHEMEYFLHKKIPTHLKYPVYSDLKKYKKESTIVRIFKEQEMEKEPEIPVVSNVKREIELEEWMEST